MPTADIVIACDGVNSTVRRQFYPQEKPAFAGINTWRGVTVHRPILSGRSYLRIGSIDTGKMVIYPIRENVDGNGNQLINWVAEVRQEGSTTVDSPTPIKDPVTGAVSYQVSAQHVRAAIADTGSVLRVPGKGAPGRNGGPAGDLLVFGAGYTISDPIVWDFQREQIVGCELGQAVAFDRDHHGGHGDEFEVVQAA